MANTISNSKISHAITSQVPFFVRNDHPDFVRFIEAYYEYLEQDTKLVNRAKNIPTYQNIDLTIDEFADKLYENFLKFIPEDIKADKKLLLKNIKDFYRARGTEKAAKFLMRIAYGEETDFYYPKKDILRASDGKWYVQQSLKVFNVTADGVPDTSLSTFEKFVNTRVTGLTTGASAIVERVDRYYDSGTLIDELVISNISGTFQNSERVCAYYDGEEATIELCADTFSGIINTFVIENGGYNYSVGDPVIILSNTGAGACAVVATVSTGNIASISVLNTGAGFRVGDYLLITGGGGTGANASLSLVDVDEKVHPNTYNIVYSTINLETNTPLNNTFYTNLNFSSVSSNLYNAMHFFQYSNTGPAAAVEVLVAGEDYESLPSLTVLANNRILQLGILGRMEIANGGFEYRVGDIIEFRNSWGGLGAGANGIVWNVNTAASNAISEVRFTAMEGHIIGGSGYDLDHLPTTNVRTSTGNSANIIVKDLLGTGATFTSANSSFGTIERISILNRGSQYEDAYVDMTGSGDGTAEISVTIIEGLFTYPGRYLNDDGFLSSYNFIQDRDYYQNFSYVIKTKQSIEKYRQMMKELNHPTGTKMFGEYTIINETYSNSEAERDASEAQNLIYYYKPYSKIANTINIAWISHGLTNNTIVYLEYVDGGYNNVKNGIYSTTNVTTHNIEVLQTYYSSNNTNGNVHIGISTA